MITIKINRDSVCMGDDVSTHEKEITINETEVFSKLVRRLIKTQYFPFVSGNNVVWTLYCGDIDICSYITKTDCIYTTFVKDEPTIAEFCSQMKDINIFFKYFTSPEERAKYIFNQNNGNQYHMWHEGYIEEYRIYGISSEREKQWRDELNLSRS